MAGVRRIPSIDSCTNVVVNSLNPATELNILLIGQDNSSRKVNLTFKSGFII